MGLEIGKGITITGAVNMQFEYPQIPTNVSLPTISGNINRGNTLSTTTGTWVGIPYDFAYTYQWQRNTSNISGANSNTYLLTNSDVGQIIRSAVTATTPVGSTVAFSANTAPILPALPTAPSNVVATPLNATTAQLTWTAPVDTGGAALTGYLVTAISSNGRPTVVATAPVTTTYNMTGLTTGGLYGFTVAAINAAGTGPSASTTADIYIIPALGEFFGGGYVIAVNAFSATIGAPSGGGSSGYWSNANTFCNNLVLNGYDDWTMPGLPQMLLMNTYRSVLGLGSGEYWTATVAAGYSPLQYWAVSVPGGTQSPRAPASFFLNVRAARTAFY